MTFAEVVQSQNSIDNNVEKESGYRTKFSEPKQLLFKGFTCDLDKRPPNQWFSKPQCAWGAVKLQILRLHHQRVCFKIPSQAGQGISISNMQARGSNGLSEIFTRAVLPKVGAVSYRRLFKF